MLAQIPLHAHQTCTHAEPPATTAHLLALQVWSGAWRPCLGAFLAKHFRTNASPNRQTSIEPPNLHPNRLRGSLGVCPPMQTTRATDAAQRARACAVLRADVDSLGGQPQATRLNDNVLDLFPVHMSKPRNALSCNLQSNSNARTASTSYSRTCPIAPTPRRTAKPPCTPNTFDGGFAGFGMRGMVCGARVWLRPALSISLDSGYLCTAPHTQTRLGLRLYATSAHVGCHTRDNFRSSTLTTMGIPGLWKTLEPVAQQISLPSYAVSTGFSGNANGKRALLLGIDASPLMYRAEATPGSPITRLYAWVERFAGTPIVPVFVFDGDDRPGWKNGRRIRVKTHQLTAVFKNIIESFGFPWFVAAGEAEATLARMTTDGVPVRIDAVQTEDGDALVFGATTVLRIVSFDKSSFNGILYSAHDIEQMLGLGADDLVLFALLAGGDYNTGLNGCGPKFATGLARAGFGRSLADGVRGKTRTEIEGFLPTWCNAVRQELATNASGFLPFAKPQLAESWPSAFPSIDILDLYLHPSVSGNIADLSLSLQPFQLDEIATFAQKNFNWAKNNVVGLLQRFTSHILPGVVVRELIATQLRMDHSLPSTRALIIRRVCRERVAPSMGQLRLLKVELVLERRQLFEALGRLSVEQAALANGWMDDHLAGIAVWVPKTLVESVAPRLVLDFISSMHCSLIVGLRADQCSEPKPKKVVPKVAKKPRAASVVQPTNREPSLLSPSTSRVHRGTYLFVFPLELLKSETENKRYTALSTLYRGKEEIIFLSDSEDEL
uniref:XPG-I domain-containing protein n=1 Tax=Mycena chlorophos TaxID=658473 RepID=A0ABQ0LD30_MYCCL|nr:predicted protein [Mycena chlorophos]